MEDSTICSKCSTKGSCCKGFELEGIAPRGKREDVEWKRAYAQSYLKQVGLDFFVFQKELYDPVYEVSRILFECTRVGQNGLCSDYEGRPQTCKSYAPMSDNLCSVQGLKGIPIFVEYV